MACDDDVIPSQARIGQVTDESDLAQVYATEWHLVYPPAPGPEKICW